MWANQYTCIASCFTAWAACSSWSILRKKKHFPLSVICQINTVFVSPLYLCCWFVISFCDGAKTFICSQEKRIISYNFFLRKKERREAAQTPHLCFEQMTWRLALQLSNIVLLSDLILHPNIKQRRRGTFCFYETPDFTQCFPHFGKRNGNLPLCFFFCVVMSLVIWYLH